MLTLMRLILVIVTRTIVIIPHITLTTVHGHMIARTAQTTLAIQAMIQLDTRATTTIMAIMAMTIITQTLTLVLTIFMHT